MGDRFEHVDRRRLAGRQRRHTPQGGLLVGELTRASLGPGELGATLGVRDRRGDELPELLEPLLRVGREVHAAGACRQDTPQPSGDRDRRRHRRVELVAPTRGATRTVDDRQRRPLVDLRARPDRDRAQPFAPPDGHDPGAVGVEAPDRGPVGLEQLRDLLADRSEQLVGLDPGRDERRDPAQRRLLVDEPRHLVVCFAIFDRRGDQVGEVLDAPLGVGRQRSS